MLAASSRQAPLALVSATSVAIGLPVLLGYNLPPSPTALNQASAIGGWGMVLTLLAWHGGERRSWRDTVRRAATAHAALALLTATALTSWWNAALPVELALSTSGALLATVLVLAAGAFTRLTVPLWSGLFAALLAAGAVSLAIGVIQVFMPEAAHGSWIARSGIPGRAVGNLRQPNHLSTLLLWSTAAVVPLWILAEAHRGQRAALVALFTLLLFGIVLSGSRTGLLGVAWLVAWAALDRSLSRGARLLLFTSPLICLASSLLLHWWSATNDLGSLGVATRLGQSDDISGARFAIWRDTLTLIAQQPWFGVGFGEFNFAWSLTPLPNRNTQFFDHTHNLPLQLIVELGIPLGLLVLGLLSWGLWQAFQRSRSVPGPEGIARRAAFTMLLQLAWHSQLEYPLWYAYFLLPTAFAWGLCLAPGGGAAAPGRRGPNWMLPAGLAMILAAALTVWDYLRVAAIFAPPADDPTPLVERIVEGRHSWFFAHHADYALVTTIEGAGTLPGAFDRAPHFLLDTRLMMAWSRALAAQGDVERARYIAERLREFRNPNAKDFFAPCDDPAVTDKPFQCSPSTRPFTWRDFVRK